MTMDLTASQPRYRQIDLMVVTQLQVDHKTHVLDRSKFSALVKKYYIQPLLVKSGTILKFDGILYG